MKPNVGVLDRFIRLLLAASLFYLGLYPYTGTTLGLGLVAGGGVLMITGLVGFCGLYRLLSISTQSPQQQR